MLAYAQAVRNLQQMHEIQMDNSRLSDQGAGLPAPELDSMYPSLRVRQYMTKLQMFLMSSPSERKRYDGAATVIQRAWGVWWQRRKQEELKALVCAPSRRWLSHG